MTKLRFLDARLQRYARKGRLAILTISFVLCAMVATAIAASGGGSGGVLASSVPETTSTPFALADLTADAVIGFNYMPETTATIEIYDGVLKTGTAAARTNKDGYFEAKLGGSGIDIKNGNRVVVKAGKQSTVFTTNLFAAADFNPGVVSGKTDGGSIVCLTVRPADSNVDTHTITNADSSGSFRAISNFSLNDRIWVSSLHPNGNLTQMELIFGTASRALFQPIVYAGDTTKTAGDTTRTAGVIEIREIKPTSLTSTTTANEVTVRLLTPGVTFASGPNATPLRLQLADPKALLSEGNTKATWRVSQSTTTTAGSIILSDIEYNVGTSTASGPVELKVGGSAGVTSETVSNARVFPSSSKTNFDLAIKVVDTATPTGDSLNGARVRILKGDGVFTQQYNPTSGSFRFDLPAGEYGIYITRLGHEAIRTTIDLTENTATVFGLNKTDIGVMVPEGAANIAFEQIESLLQDMGYRVSVITEDDLADAGRLKANLKALFINSSSVAFSSGSVSAIKEFVEDGGSLYISDASFGLMNAAFPGKLTFKANPWITVAQKINARVEDGGFADYLGLTSPANLTLDFSKIAPWVSIDKVAPEVDVYVSGNIKTGAGGSTVLNNKPLVAGFNEGLGRVLYTSYYANPENGALDENGRKLLTYCALSTLAGREISAMQANLKAEGYAVEKINVGRLSAGETSTACGINIGAAKDVKARLAVQSGEYVLSVLQPDGKLHAATAKNSSLATVSVTNAPPGEWKYWVQANDAGNGLPYVIGIGVRPTPPPPVKPGPNTGGGPSGGSGGPSGDDNDTPPAVLPEPIGLKAEAGNGKITLTWNTATMQSSAPRIAGYNIYRGTEAGLVARINSSPLTTTSYSDTAVETDITYYYWVTTVGSDGKESAPSDYATASLTAVLPDLTFKDTPAAAWYMAYVKKLVTAGIIDGYRDGRFRPNANITRAEFCKIVLAALGETPLGGAAPSFKDTGGHWAQGHIEKAKSLGFIDGYKDGRFRPNANITRAEICKIVAYAKQYRLGETFNAFPDCNGHWAEIYVATAKENGVVSGFPDGTFRPSANATRAEAAKMIAVMME
ncbi:MAG: S-layer homology domain-containing protein [Actinobacteria bacterium]|nr:S-layer homology domain-containing protein [Actinomycetota bacterium]